MAGGGGTRFWPLSRNSRPKQLLNLSGKEVMINETIDRLAGVTKKDNIFIVTNISQAETMRKVTKGRILSKHLLVEPAARNTAACIGYAAVKVLKEKGDGVLIISPSDAYIEDEKEFQRVLNVATEACDKTSKIVTIGITPTFPATGYGYIKYEQNAQPVKKVIRFFEKPTEEKAIEYLKSGDYAWNSGIFIWKASSILKAFEKYLPDIYEKLMLIDDSIGTEKEEQILKEIYCKIRSISIDYGVMEKSQDILIIPAEFGWNDVGSLDMIKVIHEQDENGNIEIGKTLTVDTTNTIIYSTTGKLISTVGVDNLIIVETEDAILVCPRDKAQDVKKIVDKLKENGEEDLL